MSVPGIWLHELYSKYGDTLFSANYRGFLGISRRRRINTGIRQSAEVKSKDFWVFNNGITLLTLGKKITKDGTRLTGIFINGAQTTGSIGSVDLKRNDLRASRFSAVLFSAQIHKRSTTWSNTTTHRTR